MDVETFCFIGTVLTFSLLTQFANSTCWFKGQILFLEENRCKMLSVGRCKALFSGCAGIQRQNVAHLHGADAIIKATTVAKETGGFLSVNGILVHWQQLGKGPNVVLGLPGLVGCYKHSFQPVFKLMDQNKFTLIGWDPPGYGKTRPPNREVLNTKMDVLRQDAHLAAKVMEKLGHERYSVIGHSNGGRTGALMGSFYPDRIQKIVMANAPQYTDEDCWKAAQRLQDIQNWTVDQRKKLKKMYEVPYLNKMLEDHEKYIENEFKSQAEAKIFDEDLKNITAPTLIIYGAEDSVVVPKHAENFNKAIANSRTHEVKNGGHDHIEFLDEFVDVTSKFLLEP